MWASRTTGQSRPYHPFECRRGGRIAQRHCSALGGSARLLEARVGVAEIVRMKRERSVEPSPVNCGGCREGYRGCDNFPLSSDFSRPAHWHLSGSRSRLAPPALRHLPDLVRVGSPARCCQSCLWQKSAKLVINPSHPIQLLWPRGDLRGYDASSDIDHPTCPDQLLRPHYEQRKARCCKNAPASSPPLRS